MLVAAYGSGQRARNALGIAEGVIDKLEVDWVAYNVWADLRRTLGHSAAAVVAVEPGDTETSRRIATLPALARRQIVLVTAPGVHESTIDDIVRVPSTRNAIMLKLPRALYEARASAFLHKQALWVDDCADVSDLMKRFIEMALLADPPIATVKALAQRSRRSDQDVWYHWRAEASSSTPKEFLQWVLLTRAVLSRPRGASWECIGRRVSASGQRLRRTSQSILTLTLDEAAADQCRTVIGRFPAYLAASFSIVVEPGAKAKRL